MNDYFEQDIINAWADNVTPWETAVRSGSIKSRVLVTDKAILEATLATNPKTVLDAGCGEGWMVRALIKYSIDCLGIDVIPELIQSAKLFGKGRYKNMPFSDLATELKNEKFDAIVCNFSLLGNESVVNLFRDAPSLLNPGGHLIVQTIHPITGCGDNPYTDGWRDGSWTGISGQFSKPAPWYFRTLESWEVLFSEYGFILKKILEPVWPGTQEPASIIFIAHMHS